MLDQQFYSDKNVAKFINNNFVPIRAVEGEKIYKNLRKIYKIQGLPKETLAKADGSLMDKYGDFESKEKFLAKIKNSMKGTETYALLLEAYEKNPDDILTALKLARKYDNIYKREMAEGILEDLYKKQDELQSVQIISEDGTESYNGYEFTKYLYGKSLIRIRKNSKVLNEFVSEYPNSNLTSKAYDILTRYYNVSNVERNEAMDFFEIVIAKYPEDTNKLLRYVMFCTQNKSNLDRAEKVAKQLIRREPENYSFRQTTADFFLAIDNKEEAIKIYGHEYINKHISSIDKNDQKANKLNSYAWYWALAGINLESALLTSKQSLKLRKDYRYLDTLSMIYWKMKKYDQAIEAEEEAIKLQSKPDPAYLQRIEDIKKDMKKSRN